MSEAAQVEPQLPAPKQYNLTHIIVVAMAALMGGGGAGTFATSNDLSGEIKTLRVEVSGEIKSLQTETVGEIKALRTEINDFNRRLIDLENEEKETSKIAATIKATIGLLEHRIKQLEEKSKEPAPQ